MPVGRNPSNLGSPGRGRNTTRRNSGRDATMATAGRPRSPENVTIVKHRLLVSLAILLFVGLLVACFDGDRPATADSRGSEATLAIEPPVESVPEDLVEPPVPTPVPARRRATSPRFGPTDGVQRMKSPYFKDQPYYLYVPPTYDATRPYRLLVVVHGASRSAERYSERFVDLANLEQYIILAPLFDESVHFQDLGVESNARADRRLLLLVAEVASRYMIEPQCFDMFGYSAGGQFAHRFLYLHPERLCSVVVGAPGTVTLAAFQRDWPIGIRDLMETTKNEFRTSDINQVRIMLLIGKEDVGEKELNQDKWAMHAGDNRRERARRLHESWTLKGIQHEYIEVPGVAHTMSDDRLLTPAFDFLALGR